MIMVIREIRDVENAVVGETQEENDLMCWKFL